MVAEKAIINANGIVNLRAGLFIYECNINEGKRLHVLIGNSSDRKHFKQHFT